MKIANAVTLQPGQMVVNPNWRKTNYRISGWPHSKTSDDNSATAVRSRTPLQSGGKIRGY